MWNAGLMPEDRIAGATDAGVAAGPAGAAPAAVRLRTPRQRARAQTVADIVRLGRQHLAQHGAAALSLRAVARDLGVVSSAVYRYVESREELLTLLLVDAYDELGGAGKRCRRPVCGPGPRGAGLGAARARPLRPSFRQSGARLPGARRADNW